MKIASDEKLSEAVERALKAAHVIDHATFELATAKEDIFNILVKDRGVRPSDGTVQLNDGHLIGIDGTILPGGRPYRPFDKTIYTSDGLWIQPAGSIGKRI